MKPMTRWGWIAAIVTVTLLAGTLDADARMRRRDLKDPGSDYTQRGLQIYAGFGGQEYNIEEREYDFLEDFDDDDNVFFLGGAIGLDRGLALFLEVAGSEHDAEIGKVAFGYANIGIKYAFVTGYRHMWQPYAKASLGGVFLWEDEDRRLDYDCDDDDNGYMGPAIGFGMGVDRFIGRRTALFAEVGMMFGQFDHVVIDGKKYDLADEIGVTSGRFLVGLRIRL